MRSLTLSMFMFVSLLNGSGIACGAQLPPSDDDGADLTLFEQTIPLEPIHEHRFNPSAVGKLSEDATGLWFEGTVDYAFGDGYPSSVSQTMSGDRWTNCSSKLRGHYEALSVEGDSAAVQAKLDASGKLVVRMVAEGSASLTVAGEYEVSADGPECGFEPGSRVPVTDVVEIHARRPTQLSVGFQDCYQADVLRVAPNVRVLPEFSLVDATGKKFQPRNANPRHPADLTVRSKEPLEKVQLTAPYGPSSQGAVILTTPQADSFVELQAPFGEATILEVVGPSRVTTDVEFGIELKIWEPVEHGDGVTMHWAKAIQVRTREEAVDGTMFCSALSDEWFTLESLTPEVCSIAPAKTTQQDPHRLGELATVHQSGECSLRLSAPELDGGVGLRRDLTVFVNKL